MLGQMSWSLPTPEAIWDLWIRSSSADVLLAPGWWGGDSSVEPVLLHNQQQLSS